MGFPQAVKGSLHGLLPVRGVPVVIMGDVIRAAVKEAGLAPDDLNMGAMANRLRGEGGMDEIAKSLDSGISHLVCPVVLVDGIRGDTEVRLFRRHFKGFCCWWPLMPRSGHGLPC